MTANQERLLAVVIFTAAMWVVMFLITELVHSLNDTGFVIYFVTLYGGLFIWVFIVPPTQPVH